MRRLKVSLLLLKEVHPMHDLVRKSYCDYYGQYIKCTLDRHVDYNFFLLLNSEYGTIGMILPSA